MPDPEVIRVMRQHKASLLAGEQAQLEEMARRWLNVERRLSGQMDALALEMTQIKRDGGTVSAELLMNQVRYRELMIQLQGELEQYSHFAEVQITAQQRRLMRLGIAHAQQAIKVQGFVGSFNKLPIAAVEYMVGYAGDGSPLNRLLVASWPEAAAGMTQELINGVALGYNPRKTAKMMAQGATRSLDRMMTIARTEQLRAYRTANLESYRASGVVTQYKRLATHDSRVCAACLMAEGTVSELSEVMPTHPQCVIEGTLVSTPQVLGTSKRVYNGFVFEIVTINGNHLTVTPNHPVLTDKGWIAAQFLKEGDNVISSIGGDGATSLIAPDNQQRPTAIEDIVAAFCESSNVISVSVPVASEDFHSDGIGSDVAIIGADGFLQTCFDAAFSYKFSQKSFFVSSMNGSRFLSRSTTAQVINGSLLPLDGFVGGFSIHPALFGGSLGLHEFIGSGTIPDGDPRLFKSLANHGSYCPKCGCQSVFGFASEITRNNFVSGQVQAAHEGDSSVFEMPIQGSTSDSMFSDNGIGINASNVISDRIVNLGSRHFSGHVYNLQTVTGWYIANGIITHNCRCTMVPIVRGLPSPQWQQGQAWFEEQPQATQMGILGKERYYRWQNGDFELSELVTVKPNAIWGDTLQTTPLRKLMGPRVAMPVAQAKPIYDLSRGASVRASATEPLRTIAAKNDELRAIRNVKSAELDVIDKEMQRLQAIGDQDAVLDYVTGVNRLDRLVELEELTEQINSFKSQNADVMIRALNIPDGERVKLAIEVPEFGKTSMVRGKLKFEPYKASTQATIKRNVAEGQKFLEGVTAKKGKIEVAVREALDRSSGGPGRMELVKHVDVDTVVHELGHVLENARGAEYRAKRIAFFNDRTRGEPLVKMADLHPDANYHESEVVYVDRWRHPYIGRVYDKDSDDYMASEVVSMGLQMLYDDPLKFLQEDSEYFDFIVSWLAGTL